MASWAKHRRHELPGEFVMVTNEKHFPGRVFWYRIIANHVWGIVYRPFEWRLVPGDTGGIVYPWK